MIEKYVKFVNSNLRIFQLFWVLFKQDLMNCKFINQQIFQFQKQSWKFSFCQVVFLDYFNGARSFSFEQKIIWKYIVWFRFRFIWMINDKSTDLYGAFLIIFGKQKIYANASHITLKFWILDYYWKTIFVLVYIQETKSDDDTITKTSSLVFFKERY